MHAAPQFEPPAEALPTPRIPEPVRTWAYAVGVVAGAAAVTFAAVGATTAAAVTAGVSTAANGLAFGYRPTR